ncbi:hypothetical protein K0M31_017987 [Melipona bicolor]|uniref:F5/8 type C domain-containing protein n=1 Tax=Melipona bicolor TaxID=60889 RepID=A0AA40FDF1_9HYME|nr:hypothetical protein K0M31_017987 [Melipona bicolor]
MVFQRYDTPREPNRNSSEYVSARFQPLDELFNGYPSSDFMSCVNNDLSSRSSNASEYSARRIRRDSSDPVIWISFNYSGLRRYAVDLKTGFYRHGDRITRNLILDSSYLDLSNNNIPERFVEDSLENCVCPQVIKGNTNTYLESKHELEPPMWASKVRFWPYSYHRRTVCMRVELYGCPWNDGIVSYSMPQGDKRGNWEFFDATYDGYWDGQLLRGLGQLTDGKIGPDNFKMSYYDYDRGQGWVGWRNDTRSGHPLEIKFEFDHVREFSAVHIFCNNQFTKDVQPLAGADERRERDFTEDDNNERWPQQNLSWRWWSLAGVPRFWQNFPAPPPPRASGHEFLYNGPPSRYQDLFQWSPSLPWPGLCSMIEQPTGLDATNKQEGLGRGDEGFSGHVGEGSTTVVSIFFVFLVELRDI